tara:strand:- start:37 stop:612 length:576 start_codon:yes stop_codon:yes gene_type:complete
MITLEDALADTSYNLELDRIKNKIARLYRELLLKSLKQSNPGATEEQIASFLEENELEFKGDGFDEEAEDLQNLIDLLMHENEELDEVKEKDYEKHDVQKGSKAKEVSEGRPAPKTANLKIAQGGLFTPSDKRTKPKVTQVSVPTPTGRIKRVATDNPKVRTEQLNTIWEKEREKLLALVRERNKEYGVVL